MPASKPKKFRKIILIAGGILFVLFVVLLIIINFYLEPILRNRLSTLVVQGSDSLYNYKLGNLKASLFGGNVEVEDLQISVDSSHYQALKEKNALPALTMELNMHRGHIYGVGIISLIFGKKINIQEILSQDANLNLSRHPHKEDSARQNRQPMWKAIQPKIKSIAIDRIKLDGIKMLYKDTDTSDAAQIQFNRCDALLEDIKVDSAAAMDTSRIGFMQRITFRFTQLKIQTPDSNYKLNAGMITYSSAERRFEIDSFYLEPTLPREKLSIGDSIRHTWYNFSFDKVRFAGIRIDQFIRNDIVQADSVIFQKPNLSMYLDASLAINYSSRIGKYPHEDLLNARSTINVRNIVAYDMQLDYSEKDEVTKETGKLDLNRINLFVQNVTNDPQLIRQNHLCTASIKGNILGHSPISALFKFYLDSTNGRFDVDGSIHNVTAEQINPVSLPLANVDVHSLNIQKLDFHVAGEDFTANSNVQMLYNNVSVVFRKTDKETGETKTKKFITKLFNKYIVYPSNPGADGVERKAANVLVARLTTQSFFGLIWKAIFAGMQNIMMKSGRVT